jgi:crotonobetainyl-CoA:carnitine CoA-transferase CaiB-like acyl-CoA transferase
MARERPRRERGGPPVKLEGLRVVDLSVFLPGPYLTLALADHGAEVIKIEPPGGDPGRAIGPAEGPSTVFFRNLNRGKKSVVLNLKEEGDRERLLELSATADVFVESFRPGVVDRLGVGYTQVSACHPGIVYCSINAFGGAGPYRDRPAHDLAVEALAGVLSMTLGDDGRPAIPGVAIADVTAALQGLSAVLMALLKRRETGRGDYVEVAMHDALLAAVPNVLGPVFAENRAPEPKAERTTGGAAFYRLYDTRDGKQIALAGQELKFAVRLLTALGRPDLVPLCERGPGPHQQPVVDCLREFFASRSQREALDRLAELDLCFAPVNTLLEAIEDPNAAARERVLVDERGRKHLAPPIRFAADPARPRLQEPALGEHTQQVLAELESRARRS